jgi:WbqC-like protein family
LTTVVITQPMLFPWPGFFEQLQLADIYIYLDDTQFSKGSFTNRVQIQRGDQRTWLTIPLAGKGSFQRICDLKAAPGDWREKHAALVGAFVKGAPYADAASQLFQRVYVEPEIDALLISSIETSARSLGIDRPRRVLRSQDMASQGRSWRRVLDLVLEAGGDRYVTGHGAANYLDHEAFEAAGVAVEYIDYSLTVWPRGGAVQTPYQSVLDLIAWTGPEAGRYLKPSTLPWRTFLKRRASAPRQDAEDA